MATGLFEEKEYESAASHELSTPSTWSFRRRPACWPVGQMLEAVLGIDAGFDPAKREIWRLLEVPRPGGVRVTPDMWFGSPAGLPTVPDLTCQRVSLFVNFKRPENYVRKGRKLFGTPYLRFSVRSHPRSPNQHAILRALAGNLSEQVAVVRYAAPAFRRRTELEGFKATRDVLRMSCFVSPLEINAPHTAWAYQGPGLLGAPNPDGEPRRTEDFESLAATVISEDRPLSNLRDHLDDLAAVCRETLPPSLEKRIEAWLDQASTQLDFALGRDRDVVGALRSLVIVSSATARAGAAWLHLVRSSADPWIGADRSRTS